MITSIFFIIPVLILAAGGYQFVRGSRTGLWPALISGAAVTALQMWAISQSRSSTAAIGILFIPIYASIAMFGVWGAHRLKHPLRYTLYLPMILILGWTIKSGLSVRKLNEARDAESEARREQIQKRRDEIKGMLNLYHGHEHEAIDLAIDSHVDDPLYVEAAFTFEEMSLERLTKLAESGKYDLHVISHPKATSHLIERVYKHAAYKDVLFSTLAGNPKTPAWILKEIDAQRDRFVGLDNNLAANPMLPSEIRQRIAGTTQGYALLELLKNPSTTCADIHLIEASLEKTEDTYRATAREELPRAKARVCK